MKDELSALWEDNKQTLEKEKSRLTSEVCVLYMTKVWLMRWLTDLLF